MRSSLALAAVALLAGGCQILSYTWSTPASVPAGRIFTMELTAQATGPYGAAGVVFQVPHSFTVLGASVVVPGYSIQGLQRDNPALLGLYTPDPGHHLAAFSGGVMPTPGPAPAGNLKVYVQAPATPGVFQFEMALAGLAASPLGPWTPQLGLSSFQTPGGSAVRAVQVAASPAAPPFTLGHVAFDAAGAAAGALEAADVDRDGRDDLVHCGASGFAWRRSIPGGFAPAVTVTLEPQLDGAVGDFDADGFVDVALSNGTVMFGDGGASWTPVVAIAGLTGNAVAAGDVDGDGIADIAYGTYGTSTSLLVLRGQPNRTFLPWSIGLPTSPPAATPGMLYVVDLDNDGRGEIVASLYGFSTPGPRVYRSTPAGVWNLVGTMPGATNVLAIDVDGNGTKELLPGGTGQVFAYTPQALVAAGTLPITGFTRGCVLDFDRDGRDDLALGFAPSPWGTGSPRMELWRNTGGGVFQPVPLPTANGFLVLRDFADVVAGDFDDDTFPDLAAASDSLLAWHNTQQGVAAYGEPCAAPASLAPDLSVQGSILPGQSGALRLANAAPLGFTLLWLGTSKTMWNGTPVLPLELGVVGAPGCTLLAEPLVLILAVADGSGVASVPFAVPQVPPFAEVTMFAQGAVVAPAANPLGLVFSRGLALKIQ